MDRKVSEYSQLVKGCSPLALTRRQDGEPAGELVATGDRGRVDDDGLLVLSR